MAWTSDDLLTAVRLRCRIPDGASVASDSELRTIADDCIATVFTPLMRQVQEEYGVKATDTTLVSGQNEYRLPSRATAGNLRDVVLYDSQTQVGLSLPRVPLEEVDRYLNGGSAHWKAGAAFALQGDKIVLLPQNLTAANTLRVRWYLRPSKLIATSAADQIDENGVSSSTLVTVGTSNITSGDTVDVIQASPNFDTLSIDDTASVSGSDITLTNGAPDVAGLDYVCPAEQTCIVQLPAELHSVLVTACSVSVWEMLRDLQGMEMAQRRLERELAQVRLLLTPRVDGEEPRVINRSGPLRGKKWGGWR